MGGVGVLHPKTDSRGWELRPTDPAPGGHILLTRTEEKRSRLQLGKLEVQSGGGVFVGIAKRVPPSGCAKEQSWV